MSSRRRTTTAPRSRRSSTRWHPTRSCTSSASAARSTSSRRSDTRRARACPSSTSRWAGKARIATTAAAPSERAVADARAAGILWVNSAGNEAMSHWSGAYSPASGAPLHQWAPNGDVGNTFVWPNGWAICGFLKWDEWPAAASDFDLGLVSSGSNRLLAVSEDEQGAGNRRSRGCASDRPAEAT